MALVTSILLSLVAVALLVVAIVSKRYRKLLVTGAIALFAFAAWKTITSAGFLASLFFIAGSIAVIGAVVYWTYHMLGRRKRRGTGEQAKLADRKRDALGRIGVAVTPLRPTGTAEIGGSRIPVSTEGEFIAAGSYVRVVARDRKQYFVRLAEPSEVVSDVVDRAR